MNQDIIDAQSAVTAAQGALSRAVITDSDKDKVITSQVDQIGGLKQQIIDLQSKLLVKSTIYTGLEKFPLFVKDQKIPFQWIQPGNTGNTGGGSSKPHGTSTWTPGPNGTIISVDPIPDYDNFDYYMVLPYPASTPSRIQTICGNWSAVSPADWLKSQQMEGPVAEYIGGGSQYTCAWAVNPHDGLQYWAGARKWQPLIADIRSLGTPTFLVADYSIDPIRRIFRYESIIVNNRLITVGIDVPAVSVDQHRKECSIAVQMDGNKAGDAYSGLLNNLAVAVWA